VKEEALLIGANNSPAMENLRKLLRFFGISCRDSTPDEVFSGNGDRAFKARVICSSECFADIEARLRQERDDARCWREHVHSFFVYATAEITPVQNLLRRLTGDEAAAVTVLGLGDKDFYVSDMVELCGPMAGLRVTASESARGNDFVMRASPDRIVSIIAVDHGSVFLRLQDGDVPVFLFGGSMIIDIESNLTTGVFDIRDHVLAALPIVLYVKWAFPMSCWRAPEINACLVIDDPLLKPTHGFVDFAELLSLMKRHHFSTNIAFIPWNWRRSDRQVVRMFAENPNHYSISVHGCDHTRAEFGGSNPDQLSGRVHRALERMAGHQSRTGLRYNRVMIFPQGVFSDATMGVLKRTELIGAINNDTISADPQPRSISISDVWDIAIMSYHTFPLFTRRYPWKGIENFAFDIILGKPAIVVIHHDYCSDHCRRLTDFIDRLNALKCPLAWHDLGEILRRSYRMRRISPGLIEVEMYSSELRLMNQSDIETRFHVRKRECDPAMIEKIDAGSRPLSWSVNRVEVEFELNLKPGENTIVRIQFKGLGDSFATRNSESLSYKAQTMLRRYYCELRDNYLAKMQLAVRSMHNG